MNILISTILEPKRCDVPFRDGYLHVFCSRMTFLIYKGEML